MATRFIGFLLLGALAGCTPAASPDAPAADGVDSCQQLSERVVSAHQRITEIQSSASEATAAQYLAVGDVMDRLDKSLATVKAARDEVRLVIEEYRIAARSMAVASHEAGELLVKGEDATAKLRGEHGPRELPHIVERMVAHCKQTRDDTCRRIAAPVTSLGEGTPSPERIVAARAELGAITTADATLRGSIDAMREKLDESAKLMSVVRDIEGRRQARVDAYARAAEGFAGLSTQANAACHR